jgi:hypothetical protein
MPIPIPRQARKPRRDKPDNASGSVVGAGTLYLADIAAKSEAFDENTEEQPLTCEIDVSQILIDTPTFTINNLAVYEMFRARRDAQHLLARNPKWTDECALIVAVLAMTHHLPALPIAKGLFYESLANSQNAQKAALFATLFNAVLKAFPHLVNLGGEVEQAKNA